MNKELQRHLAFLEGINARLEYQNQIATEYRQERYKKDDEPRKADPIKKMKRKRIEKSKKINRRKRK